MVRWVGLPQQYAVKQIKYVCVYVFVWEIKIYCWSISNSWNTMLYEQYFNDKMK